MTGVVLGVAGLGVLLVCFALVVRRFRWDAVDFDEWDKATSAERKRAYLRHPAHRPRCWCGRYGLPFEIDEVIDDDLEHTKEGCRLWG